MGIKKEQRRPIISLLLVAAMLLVGLFIAAPNLINRNAEAADGLSTEEVQTAWIGQDGAVSLTTNVIQLPTAAYTYRNYKSPDNMMFSTCRLETTETTPQYKLQSFEMPGIGGMIRWYDLEAKQWVEQPMETRLYLKGMYFLTVGDSESIVCTAQTYANRENSTREYLPKYDGSMQVQATGTGYTITLYTRDLPKDVFSDQFIIRSSKAIVDWADEEARERWAGYRFTDDNRWCLDGYYYATPDDYYPSGENYFRNMPAAYIGAKLTRDPGAPPLIGLVMLDVMNKQWNGEAYVPSTSGSRWLKDDYDIDPGYFDTRFNTELAAAQLDAVTLHKVDQWLPEVVNYANFLVGFAQNNHYEFGTDKEPAWLVQDYSHKEGGTPTHASLNHHLAEILFLYKLVDITGEARYETLADTMLRGVEQTEELWYMPNGSLHYAYLADGSMGLLDYPFLTYNDLLALQQELVARGDGENDAITRLMASKLRWMNANGVTAYNR